MLTHPSGRSPAINAGDPNFASIRHDALTFYDERARGLDSAGRKQGRMDAGAVRIELGAGRRGRLQQQSTSRRTSISSSGSAGGQAQRDPRRRRRERRWRGQLAGPRNLEGEKDFGIGGSQARRRPFRRLRPRPAGRRRRRPMGVRRQRVRRRYRAAGSRAAGVRPLSQRRAVGGAGSYAAKAAASADAGCRLGGASTSRRQSAGGLRRGRRCGSRLSPTSVRPRTTWLGEPSLRRGPRCND